MRSIAGEKLAIDLLLEQFEEGIFHPFCEGEEHEDGEEDVASPPPAKMIKKGNYYIHVSGYH